MINAPSPAKATSKPLDEIPVIKRDPTDILAIRNGRNDRNPPNERTEISGNKFSPRLLANYIKGSLERFWPQFGTKVLVTAAILNVLQLIIFFIIYLVIQPRKIRERLQKNDMSLMITNVPDEMINYGFFERSAVY